MVVQEVVSSERSGKNVMHELPTCGCFVDK